MTPATHNLFDALIRALSEVAEAALEPQEAGELRHNLGQQLGQAKVIMQHTQSEDIAQDTAIVAVALSKLITDRRPIIDERPLQRKHLQQALHDLEKRYEENCLATGQPEPGREELTKAEDGTSEDIGLDQGRWLLIRDPSGRPVAAISSSLSIQEKINLKIALSTVLNSGPASNTEEASNV